MLRKNRILTLLLLVTLALAACQPVIMPAEQAKQVAPETEPPTILVQGAPFHGANGINFGPDGNLYIASVDGDEIVVMDPETGEFLNRYGADRGVLAPDDLAFAPDGSAYFASLLTGKVGRLTPDGEVDYVAELTIGVNPITFADDGRLFVAQCFMDDKLYEVDPAGTTAPRLISDQLGPHCGLNGMEWCRRPRCQPHFTTA